MIVMVVTVSAMKDTLVQIVKDAPMDTLTVLWDVVHATVTLTILNLTAFLLAATARILEGQANLMARELAKNTVSPSLLIDMECQPFLHVCFTVLPQSTPLIWRVFFFFFCAPAPHGMYVSTTCTNTPHFSHFQSVSFASFYTNRMHLIYLIFIFRGS